MLQARHVTLLGSYALGDDGTDSSQINSNDSNFVEADGSVGPGPYTLGADFNATPADDYYGVTPSMATKIVALQNTINRGLSKGLIGADGKFGQNSLDGFMAVADDLAAGPDTAQNAAGAQLQAIYGGAETDYDGAIIGILSNIDTALALLTAGANAEGWQVGKPTTSSGRPKPTPPFVPKKLAKATWYYYVGGSAVALASLVLFYYEATKSPKAKKRRNFRKFKKS